MAQQSSQSAGAAASSDPIPPLAEIIAVIRGLLVSYLVLPQYADLIIALWVVFTYAFKRFMHAPRLVPDSLDPGFGKTTLLDVMANICNNAQRVDDLTAASYHHLDAMYGNATTLLDEADGYDFRGGDHGLTRIFNAGHRRDSRVMRVIKGRRVSFPVFGPIAAAAIDARITFTRAMAERSIIIAMPLATRAQSKRLRRLNLENPSVVEEFAAVRVALSAWSHDAQLDTDPQMPDEVHNRAADNFRPLVSIADAASPELGELARQVAVAMAKAHKTIGERVLRDCRTVFVKEHMSSVAVVEGLLGLEGGEWGECRGERGNQSPRPLNPAMLANLLRSHGLRRFGIQSRTVRWGGGPKDTFTGYRRAWFEPAWRWLDGKDDEDEEQRVQLTVVRGGRISVYETAPASGELTYGERASLLKHPNHMSSNLTRPRERRRAPRSIWRRYCRSDDEQPVLRIPRSA